MRNGVFVSYRVARTEIVDGRYLRVDSPARETAKTNKWSNERRSERANGG